MFHGQEPTGEYISKLYVMSAFTPGHLNNQGLLKEYIQYFEKYLCHKLKDITPWPSSNLRKQQEQFLQTPCNNDDIVISPCGENMGQSIIK